MGVASHPLTARLSKAWSIAVRLRPASTCNASVIFTSKHLLGEVAGGAEAALDVVRGELPHVALVRGTGVPGVGAKRPSAVAADDLAGQALAQGW